MDQDIFGAEGITWIQLDATKKVISDYIRGQLEVHIRSNVN